MAIEIERRFLLHGEEWKDYAISSTQIRQGYLAMNFEEWIVRIRIIDDKEAYIGLKKSLNGITNDEFEYIIPIQDAESIWEKLDQKIIKTRFDLKFGQGSWIVDCFHGKNDPLIIAEIELENTQSILLKPKWCGKEITGQKKLANAGLAMRPISNWSSQELKILNLD